MDSPLKVVVHELKARPGMSGLCAGFEQESWRSEALARFLMEFLPEFCLPYTDYSSMNSADAVAKLRKVATTFYTSEKFELRGEFGELLLHAALKQLVNTIPAISKMYYKDSANDTVKGFDAVHVVPAEDGLALWLGEVKLYSDIAKAISDSAAELARHVEAAYLKSEFIAIQNKIDPEWPYAERLKALLHEHVSLDQVFQSLNFAVLLTFDGQACAKHSSYCEAYFTELVEELWAAHAKFAKKVGSLQVKVHLILIPLRTKDVLVAALHRKLSALKDL